MSLILDALKRVERDRRVDRAPDLNALYESEPAVRKRRWPWVLLIVLVALNLVILGILFRSEKPDRQSAIPTRVGPPGQGMRPPVASGKAPMQAPTVSPPDPKPSASEATDTTPAAKPLTETAVKPPTPRPAPSPPESEVHPPVSDLPVQTRPLSQEARVASVPKEKPPLKASPSSGKGPVTKPKKAKGTPAVQPEARPGPEKAAVVANVPDSSEKGQKIQSDADASGSPASGLEEKQPDAVKPEEPAEAPAPGSAVALAMDLPDDIREQFKGLKINVHAFYENPDESFVFINMRRYVAGDRIAGLPMTLVAITPEGVILDYGKGQALLLTEN